MPTPGAWPRSSILTGSDKVTVFVLLLFVVVDGLVFVKPNCLTPGMLHSDILKAFQYPFFQHLSPK